MAYSLNDTGTVSSDEDYEEYDDELALELIGHHDRSYNGENNDKIKCNVSE